MKQMQMMIKVGLEKLDALMQDNRHLTEPGEVLVVLATLAEYWDKMSEKDKDFAQRTLLAMEAERAWHEPRVYAKK